MPPVLGLPSTMFTFQDYCLKQLTAWRFERWVISHWNMVNQVKHQPDKHWNSSFASGRWTLHVSRYLCRSVSFQRCATWEMADVWQMFVNYNKPTTTPPEMMVRKRDLSKMIFFQVNDCDSERFSQHSRTCSERAGGDNQSTLTHSERMPTKIVFDVPYWDGYLL